MALNPKAMIKASELRIGNIVEVEGQIWGILDSRLLVRIEREPDCANPVPLSPEWLERMGFKTFAGTLQLDCLGIDARSNEMECLFSSRDDWEPMGAKPLQYVHQLQNLFFALTGQELNILINS